MIDSESGWKVRPLSPALGAEVIGPKVTRLNDDEVKELKKLLLEHLVIFMPDQFLSPEASKIDQVKSLSPVFKDII